MKTAELRVGSTYLINGEIANLEVNHLLQSNQIKIEPILINKEWMEKMGWKNLQLSNENELVSEWESKRGFFPKGQDTWRFKLDESLKDMQPMYGCLQKYTYGNDYDNRQGDKISHNDEICYLAYSILHVHQLQNLMFALTHIE